MSSTNNFIFKGLTVIAWIIFVGLCIEAGALLFNFIYSLFKPEVVKNLYQKLDLSEMYKRSELIYFGMYGFILCIAFLKAVMFYYVILLTGKINLTKPFSEYVSKQISIISYLTFSIGVISYIARQTAKNMTHYGIDTENLNKFWSDSQVWILMAAVIYVIAVIFKKGIEIQNENDLTV